MKAGTHLVGATFIATGYRPQLNMVKEFDRKSIENEPLPQLQYDPVIGLLKVTATVVRSVRVSTDGSGCISNISIVPSLRRSCGVPDAPVVAQAVAVDLHIDMVPPEGGDQSLRGCQRAGPVVPQEVADQGALAVAG